MVHVEVFKTFLPILYWGTNLPLYVVIYWYFWSVCRQCFCLRIVCLTNANIQKNCAKQVHRAVLRLALYILSLELLDLYVVWASLGVLWGDLGGYRQFYRCCFSISLCQSLHQICRFCKKVEDVRTADRSFLCFCSDHICEPWVVRPPDTTNICWVFKCCFTHFHVCISIIYHQFGDQD